LVPKFYGKFEPGDPNGGSMHVWYVKIGDFRQITRYNSKMAQVSISVEWEVVCTLSNGDIADNFE